MGNNTVRVDEPVIIIGAPRSGTTLLATLLEEHPDVAVSKEPRLVWRYRNDRRSDQLGPEHATPAVVDHIHGYFGELVRRHGVHRLVEKTPANALRPWFVDAVFPDARYVHITRNGWGAVPSMRTFWERRATGFDGKQLRKAGRRVREARLSQLPFYAPELLLRVADRWSGHRPVYGPHVPGLQQVADELGVLEASALQWRSCVERTATFGRGHAAARYLEVKLESLDTRKIGELLEFCHLAPSSSVTRRFEQLYRAQEATRRGELSSEESERVAPYVLPVNAWLGYLDPEPLGRISVSGRENGRRAEVRRQ